MRSGVSRKKFRGDKGMIGLVVGRGSPWMPENFENLKNSQGNSIISVCFKILKTMLDFRFWTKNTIGRYYFENV